MHKEYPAWARLYRAHAQIEAVAEATPLIASALAPSMATFSLCSNVCYRTTDKYDKEQILPLALLEARLTPAFCLAGLSKRAALSRRSFNNASLYPEA